MIARTAQNQVSLTDFYPHFGGRGHVVHALGAGEHLGMVQRPRYTAQVFDGDLAVGMQADHRSGLAWHHDTMAGGDTTEVSLLKMEDSIAACFDECCGRGHLVIEPSTVKTDHMHLRLAVMLSTP